MKYYSEISNVQVFVNEIKNNLHTTMLPKQKRFLTNTVTKAYKKTINLTSNDINTEGRRQAIILNIVLSKSKPRDSFVFSLRKLER